MRFSRTLVAVASLALGAACGGLGDTSDTGGPQLVIISPTDGATVARNVLIEAQALDDTGVDKVRFLIDGTLLAEALTAPYRVTWNTGGLADGSVHTIRVEALDFAHNVTVLQISVTVGNAQGAP